MTTEITTMGCAIGLVLGAWLYVAALCLGLGLLWYRLWRTPVEGADRLFMAFWVGFALTLGFLQLWHFAAPVNGFAAAFLSALAVVSLTRQRAALRALLPTGRAGWGAVAFAGILALWLAHQSLRPLEHYDTGLYLLGAMHWFADHPLVPGLGNLHGRFAFNNASLLFAALLDRGPWAGRVPHVASGALLFVFLLQCAAAARPLLAGRGERASAAFAALLPVPALLLANRYLVSLSTDLCVTLLALVATWRAFRVLADGAQGARRIELLDISLLVAAGITVKLSAVVFLGGVWCCALIAHLRDGARAGANVRLDAVLAGLVLTAMLAPWLVRGVLLSGYPFFPSTLVSLPFDWRVPEASVAGHAAGVKAWARVPGVPRELTLEGWFWLESWLRRHGHLSLRVGFPLPMLLGALGMLLAAVGGSLGRRVPTTRALWLVLPASLAFGFWFWMAPDPRFAMFVFWSFAATGFAAAVAVWSAGGSPQRASRASLVLCVALVAAVLPTDTGTSRSHAGFPPVPRVATQSLHTDSGLAINVPIGSPQCWAAEQPCAPRPRPGLRLRREGRPRRGFARGG